MSPTPPLGLGPRASGLQALPLRQLIEMTEHLPEQKLLASQSMELILQPCLSCMPSLLLTASRHESAHAVSLLLLTLQCYLQLASFASVGLASHLTPFFRQIRMRPTQPQRALLTLSLSVGERDSWRVPRNLFRAILQSSAASR